MDRQAAVRSLVREGCRLLDATDGQTAAAVIDAVHAALVTGVDASCIVQDPFAQPQSTGADAASWRGLHSCLERLEQQRTTDDVDSVRACFFWGAFEPWAASLLTGMYRRGWARWGIRSVHTLHGMWHVPPERPWECTAPYHHTKLVVTQNPIHSNCTCGNTIF